MLQATNSCRTFTIRAHHDSGRPPKSLCKMLKESPPKSTTPQDVITIFVRDNAFLQLTIFYIEMLSRQDVNAPLRLKLRMDFKRVLIPKRRVEILGEEG